jgi:hypothetical protein
VRVGGEWRYYPKPFSYGYLFGSVPEKFMIWAYKGDKPEVKDFWKEFALGVAGTLSPIYDPASVLPPLVKVAFEDVSNYNFFTGRNIYPAWMDRYTPEKRATKGTSETSKFIGEQLKISPAKIDNTIRGTLAGAGKYALEGGDQIIKAVKKWNGEVIPENPTTSADIPILKAFTGREPTGYRSISASNFFDNWKAVSEVKATINSLEGDKREEFQQKNQELLRAYRPMKSFYDRIRGLGKISNRIYEDKLLGSDDKVEQLSDIGGQILDIAREANTWHKENVKDKD